MFAQNSTQESMFREAIKAELKRRKIPVKRFSRDHDLNYSNFNEFLNGSRDTYPLEKIEKVMECLQLVIKRQSDPSGN